MDLYTFMSLTPCEEWITVIIINGNDNDREELARGEWYDLRDEYEDYEIQSWDVYKENNGDIVLCIDIDYEEEDE